MFIILASTSTHMATAYGPFKSERTAIRRKKLMEQGNPYRNEVIDFLVLPVRAAPDELTAACRAASKQAQAS